jgi:hypothetical protein
LSHQVKRKTDPDPDPEVTAEEKVADTTIIIKGKYP